MENSKIKTVDIQAKEWFDKRNGNSYFGGIITVNFGEEDQKQISIPFQYGYGDQYRFQAFKLLQEKNLIPKQESNVSYWRYYEDNNIITRHTKHENCLKREVINFSIL